MKQVNYTTERSKGQHLTFKERVIIETRLKDGWSRRRIARELNCSPSTVTNEIERGEVLLYKGKVKRYKAKAGQQQYEENRIGSCRKYKLIQAAKFIQYAQERFRKDAWSYDAICGRARNEKLFPKDEMVCTKTLYNYTDKQLIEIANIDLPVKVKRKHKHPRIVKNKRIMGRSIEERPETIGTRKEFGHWEADLVIGEKSHNDNVLLVLLERKSRDYQYFRLPGKESKDVLKALESVKEEYGDCFSRVFKTITTDNGSEFADLSDLEQCCDTLVYYAHPYSSYEKGSIENHNGLLRRFVPKGKRIEDFSDEELEVFFMILNALPRKILGYKTPEEVFDEEMDKLFAA